MARVSRLSGVCVVVTLAAGAGAPGSAQEQEPRSARTYCLKVAADNQGMTIDAYHDWPTYMGAPSAFEETWPKVHPGLSFSLVEGFKQSVRASSHNALFRVVHTTTD